MAKSVPGFESNWELVELLKIQIRKRGPANIKKTEDNMPGRMVQNT